jgi:hypothetical protein
VQWCKLEIIDPFDETETTTTNSDTKIKNERQKDESQKGSQ